MKKIFLINTLIIIASFLFAQAPQKFKYQIIVRANDGSIIANKTVSFKISLLQDNATGTVAYAESHSILTSANGEANLNIGSGTPLTNSFASISWATHSHFLKVELDITGGTNYVFLRTIEILSVPYALYAKNIDNVAMLGDNGGVKVINCTTCDVGQNGVFRYNSTLKKMQFCDGVDWRNTDETFVIGQDFGGGIIFYVDESGKHGLVCAPSDQSSSIRWNTGFDIITGASGTAIGTGQGNTTAIVNKHGIGSYAAQLCNDLVLNGHSDWFLPAKDELTLLYNNLKINNLGSFTNNIYWSSTEGGVSNVWTMLFSNGNKWNGAYKGNPYYVRAIRAF